MKQVIKNTEKFVQNTFSGDSTGHDWFHMDRVRKNALKIFELEGKGNKFIIEMGALLHDVLDEKLQKNVERRKASLLTFLINEEVKKKEVEQILYIIENISFRGGNEKELQTIEAKIVRDADRLDAIGAIGIARVFAYGATIGNPIFDPNIQIREKMTEEQYRTENSSSIHHFYEKLLKLKDLMLTKGGKKLAEERHRFMEEFLKQFFKEWNGDS